MIDILVPVLRRPVQEMVASLEAATSVDFRLIFICSPGDETGVASCNATGREVWLAPWLPDRADFAKKINWAFPQTNSEWIFQGADDIRFSAGWDVEALKVGQRASVVGTNDLHNPAVKARRHSTHTLFRRSYIEEYGGTLDGSGIVFSEAYDHQFVDNEFLELAKVRGQWAFATRSIVEHLHPVWGLAEWDPTYEKAFRETSQDAALFSQRMRQVRRRTR